MIRKELAEEEKRLDKMMEMEWEKGAAVQEELERQRKQEMMRWAEAPSSPWRHLAHSHHTMNPVHASIPTMGSRTQPEGTRNSALVFPEPGRTL